MDTLVFFVLVVCWDFWGQFRILFVYIRELSWQGYGIFRLNIQLRGYRSNLFYCVFCCGFSLFFFFVFSVFVFLRNKLVAFVVWLQDFQLGIFSYYSRRQRSRVGVVVVSGGGYRGRRYQRSGWVGSRVRRGFGFGFLVGLALGRVGCGRRGDSCRYSSGR